LKVHDVNEKKRSTPPSAEGSVRGFAAPKVRKRVILILAAIAVCAFVLVLALRPYGIGEKSGDGQDDPYGDVSVTPGLEPASPAIASEGEGAESDSPATQKMLANLIDENNEKIERKEAALVEMRNMLDLLTETEGDPARIERYRKLIEDTERDIQEIADSSARYEADVIKE
jgi:hypothetical protein